jgi:hypothetical protein
MDGAVPNSRSRATRLSEFSPFGRLFILVILKNHKKSPNFSAIFFTETVVYRMGWATTFCIDFEGRSDVFTLTSGANPTTSELQRQRCKKLQRHE